MTDVDLNALQLFVKVVQTGSFTAGSRALGVPRSTASQRIAELEERLGARLLHRTTRKIGLTDQGRVYYEHCLRIFEDVEAADRAVTSLQQRPRGLLRLTAPASTQFLGPFLAEFLRQCSGVQLDVVLTDRVVDLVEDSFDLAIRAGALSDSSLVARKLGTISFVVVASPRYLERRGRPRQPGDLARHDCLVFSTSRYFRRFRLVRDEASQVVSLTPALAVNDFDILHAATIRGAGIAILPAFRCTEDLRAGRLERVLPEWAPPKEPVHALYPSGHHLSPKVKAMLDQLQSSTAMPWSSTGDVRPRSVARKRR